MAYQFPKNFWWGTATASHQVEGGNVYNDTWLMEHTPAPFSLSRPATPSIITTAMPKISPCWPI